MKSNSMTTLVHDILVFAQTTAKTPKQWQTAEKIRPHHADQPASVTPVNHKTIPKYFLALICPSCTLTTLL